MKIEKISISVIVPNSWNSNELPPALFQKLVAKIKRVGYTQPIEVRALPLEKSDCFRQFQIIDGEHRFLACQEAGLKEIQCVVSEYSDSEAKTETLAKNKLRGEFDPVKTAALIADLCEDLELPEISELSGFNENELNDLLRLENTPDLADVFGKINDDSSLQIKEIRFVYPAKNSAEIEATLAKIKKELKPKYSGEILLKLCQIYEKSTC